MAEPSFECFAVAAPGLEPLVARELDSLGMAARGEVGGVAWNGSLDSVMCANLWLRTASRVVVRIARFRARGFPELERQASRIEWERFAPREGAVAFRVTSKKSRLYHTGGIADRLATAIRKRLGAGVRVLGAPDDDDGADGAVQQFVVRINRDEVTVSADSSGALLHRRGYRQATGKAPLRETLAAALLLASDWRADAPLLDPMCGSGTIPIEAAMMARRIAPGLERRFAFEHWPGFDRAAWERIRDDAKRAILPRAPAPIAGSDRDAGAVDASRANAARAGVASDIDFAVRALSAARIERSGDAQRTQAHGWIVTNPPYGVRVGETRALRDLFARLGHLLRGEFAGWALALLSPDAQLEAQVGLAFEERLRTSNGGIPVRVLLARGAQARVSARSER